MTDSKVAMRILIVMFTLVAVSVANAGGWVSAGGGELFKDAHNPWFLKNSRHVSYCVQVASGSVSASPEDVKGAVREAIDFWKSEFLKAGQTAGHGQFELGTQQFEEVACSDSIELRFLVGYETLKPDEIKFLVDPTNYIGISVRTDYDAELRGKGFVYISSDMGPKAYHGGLDATLIPEAWKRQRLLKYAVLHELGHVFGLPHTGSGLMSETFLEQILSKNLADAFTNTPISSFFAVDDDLQICNTLTSSGRGFFAVPPDHKCLRFVRKPGARWEVTSFRELASGETKLGTVIAPTPVIEDFQSHPAIMLQLMGNTTVFSPKETLFRPFMFGPMFVEYALKGNFVPAAGGQSKSVYMKLTADSMVVQGVNGTKIDAVFAYISPIGILLLQDPTP